MADINIKTPFIRERKNVKREHYKTIRRTLKGSGEKRDFSGSSLIILFAFRTCAFVAYKCLCYRFRRVKYPATAA